MIIFSASLEILRFVRNTLEHLNKTWFDDEHEDACQTLDNPWRWKLTEDYFVR